MSDVLRRKLGANRAPKKTSGVSVESILRKTMPRNADAVLSMDLRLLAVSTSSVEKEELLEAVVPSDLLFLVENSDGARGIAILDPQLMTAIIEAQVSGKVTDKPPPDRAPTNTDAIVASEILDTWLATAEAAVIEAGLDSAWPMIGFERSPGKLTVREADLLLDPVEFRVTDVELSLGGGLRTGRLRFAAPRLLPLLEGQISTRAAKVRRHLPDLPVEMRAVLARLPLGVSRIGDLKPDEVLPLPAGCLQHVRLETRAEDLIREVRLGQLGGKKAVRLTGLSAVGEEMPGIASAPAALAPAMEADLPVLGEAAVPGDPVGDLPDLPEINEPAFEPSGDLPDLPELPDLPDLPDLPELP